MTAAKTEPRGLHAKLAEVMAEAERIPKNGKAPAAMGGFPFVQVGDAADHIRKALGSRGVSMLPTTVEILSQAEHATKSGGTMTTVELRITWTLTDGETGQSATLQSYGVGADSGDKYSGKATTTAMKYALLSGWLLSTGDDVETADTSDRQAPTRQTSGGETTDLMGIDTVTGVVKVGGSDRYKAEWREQPDGSHVIGFALSRNGDKDLPQVGVMGSIADALYASGESLVGQRVTVRGSFYSVRAPGRTTFVRVIVGQRPDDFIETPEVRIPPAEPVEAPSVGMFEETPLTDEERAAIAGGVA